MHRRIVRKFRARRFEGKSPYIFLLFVFFLSSLDCLSQTAEPFTLELNKPIERKLFNKSESQNFQIKLANNQYTKIIIEQRELDVTAQLYAPDGKLITKFDYEPRLKEKEEVGFIAESAGEYRLEIKPKYINSAGNYDIKLAELREPNERDRALFDAHILSVKMEEFDLTGKYDDALSTAKTALEIGEKHLPKDDAYLGFLLNRLGAAQRRKGDYATAEATLQRALAMNEKTLGAEHPRTVDTLRYLGLVYLATDEFAKAEKMFRQSLAICEKTLGMEHPRVTIQLLGLQTLMFYLADDDQAEKYGNRALAIAEKTLEPTDVVVTYILNNLATIYQSKGDYERSEPMFRRVLGIYEKTIGTENNDYALTLQNLANSVRRKKDYPQAIKIYEQAIVIREKTLGKEHLNIAPLLISLASVYHAMGDYPKAIEIYKRSFAIAEKSGGLYHEYTYSSLTNMANSYAAQGDVENALAYQTLTQERTEMALALNLAIGSERQKLLQIESTVEDTSRAISLNVNLAPDNPKASALAALLILQRKGRVLDAMSDASAALLKRANPEDKKLLDQLNSIVEQLAKATLNKSPKFTIDEQRKQIETLTEEKEDLEAEISRRSAEFRNVAQPVTLEAVKAEIPSNSALIEYAVYYPFNPKPQGTEKAHGEPHYIAYILQQTGDVKWKDLGDKKTIDQTINEWRKALRDPNSKDVQTLARTVDERILQPVRNAFGDTAKLFISPDGELNMIPFEALIDEKGHYRVENYSFTYLTSGRDLLRMKNEQDNKNQSLIVANPSFGETVSAQNTLANASLKTTNIKSRRSVTATRNLSDTYFSPLGGTIQEARSIQTLFPDAEFLTGAEATETAIKQIAAPRMLHIATHGFFLEDSGENAEKTSENEDEKVENPLLRSGLALAGANKRNAKGDDGILTALEASGLNLWGTKLVVLSACDTGLGEVKNGEGVYGLRRAFTLAGAESLVMSLWAVSDYVTREIMVDYYKNLKQGIGRGESLRQVQLKMLKKPTRQHPFYWASFIQSGEWANLDGKR